MSPKNIVPVGILLRKLGVVLVTGTLAAGTLGSAPLKVALYVDDGCRGNGLLRWAEIFRDSSDLSKPESYVHEFKDVTPASKMAFKLAPCGGFIVKFTQVR